MRRLIQIPIIHAAADLGSLSDAVRARYARVSGNAGWSQHERAVRALWAGIQRELDRLKLDARKLRIYQDGLPVCGFEERIVRELAQAGSANHQLVVALLDRGATVTGTEDPRLLMEEYELQKRGFPPGGTATAVVGHPANLPIQPTIGAQRQVGNLPHEMPVGNLPHEMPVGNLPHETPVGNLPRGTRSSAAPKEQEGLARRLLEARDSFIAERIDATLREGETGLLFLGALHRLGALESKGISVATLGDVLHEAVRRPGP
jgi:hypothetical protein